jgi:hypothetical protein
MMFQFSLLDNKFQNNKKSNSFMNFLIVYFHFIGFHENK